MLLGSVSSLLMAFGVQTENFWIFLSAVLSVGISLSVVAQFRFAAAENASRPDLVSRAVSVLLLANIMAGVIGTELATKGINMLSRPYAGSFIIMSISFFIAFLFLGSVKNSAGTSH